MIVSANQTDREGHTHAQLRESVVKTNQKTTELAVEADTELMIGKGNILTTNTNQQKLS